MSTLKQLQKSLEVLESQVVQLKEQGYIPYPADFVIDSSEVKGKTYYRRRQKGTNGKPGKSEQISQELYAELDRELQNGRSLYRLEKQIKQMVAKIDRLALLVG